MPRFDTEGAVRQWRARMETRTDIAPESVDELEVHLAESIDDLSARGLTEEEAFLVSVRRLGDADALRVEFGKVEQGSRALEIGVTLLVGIPLLSALSTLLSQLVLWSVVAFGLESTLRSVYSTDSYAVLAAVGVAIWMVGGLAVFFALAGSNGARWRRGVDWFRRLALRSQVLIVLASALTVLFVRLPLHYLAARVVRPETFGLLSIVTAYGWVAFQVLLVPALAIWLLVRLRRPAAEKAELAGDPTSA